jgi:hypothetical protein
MDQFKQALQESAWDRALSYCSDVVHSQAKKYESPEALFRTIVPIDDLVRLSSYPVCGAAGRLEDPDDFTCFVRLPKLGTGPRISWSWHLRRSKTGWLVDFREIPLNKWIELETNRLLSQAEEIRTGRKALDLKLLGVRTHLTSANREVALGHPILVRLGLINGGTAELLYDHQQVACNASMTVTDESGECVPYVAPLYQTGGAPTSIKPGESVVLFDSFDLSKQYDIRKPGRYAVQFSGRGLSIGEGRDVKGRRTGSVRNDARLASNIISIVVTSNE